MWSKNELFHIYFSSENVLSRKICEFIWKLDRNFTFVQLGPHKQILGLFVKFTTTFLSVLISTYRKSSIKPPSQTSPLPLISAPFQGKKVDKPPLPYHLLVKNN